ncbi:uncharacterized protein [Nicotiana sylvestris]|uniref:uncharacterized protein n=1 Tax=Nicotiana sylvestris TaxID=4096 RepID=UPI00388C9E00
MAPRNPRLLSEIFPGPYTVALDDQALDNRFVSSDILERSQDTVQRSDVKDVTICDDGVLRMHGRICVPNVDGLHELTLDEDHSSWYSIHPGSMKMYQDLRQHYWWRRMKKNILEYVAQCLNCQQVKYEY